MDHGEPHWWTNSSFSPPLRFWDCRLHSNGFSQGSNHGDVTNVSSIPSNGKGNRRRAGSDRYSKHHHSVSDGVLSYSASPTGYIQAPRQVSPLRKFNVEESSSSSVPGSTPGTSWFPRSIERAKMTQPSPSFGSPSPLSDSCHWKSAGRHRISINKSKAIYPLMFRNPVSDGELAFGDTDVGIFDMLAPGTNRISPYSINHNKPFAEFQTPDPSASSRREGFRWSSGSSYDLGSEGYKSDVADDMCDLVTGQKCTICGKCLGWKSPWSSRRIVKGGDLPITGVLSCSHVYHAECLEQVTPKSDIHDPPCPLCLKTVKPIEESVFALQPLELALRSVRRSNCVVKSEAEQETHRLRRNWPRWNATSSSLKNRLKNQFPFRGKASKDIFGRKVMRMGESSSSSSKVS